MSKKELRTVGEVLHWAYANLAMGHAAVKSDARRYGTVHYSIRARLYKGLCDGSMQPGSLVEDDRLKMLLPQACSYCGSRESLSVDHLFPKSRVRFESGDNIVWACRPCNSAKGSRDLLEWFTAKGDFPSVYLLRRYLKLAIDWSRTNDQLRSEVDSVSSLPFALTHVPRKLPPPPDLKLWIVPLAEINYRNPLLQND